MKILIVSLEITQRVFLPRMPPFEIWIDRFEDTYPLFDPKCKKKNAKNTFEHFLGSIINLEQTKHFFCTTPPLGGPKMSKKNFC